MNQRKNCLAELLCGDVEMLNFLDCLQEKTKDTVDQAFGKQSFAKRSEFYSRSFINGHQHGTMGQVQKKKTSIMTNA